MKYNESRGFTLVEVVLIVPIALLTIAGLVAFLISLYTDVLKDTALSRLAYEAQNALLSIKDDAYTAASFEETIGDEVNDSYAPSGGWNHNTAPFPLIISEIALNHPNELVNTRIVYHRQPNGCLGQAVNNTPVINNLIYYIDEADNFRRRVLVPDPVHDYCKTPYRQQTCPISQPDRLEEQLDGSFVEVACPADAILATGVVSLDLTYYDAVGNQIILPSGSSPLDAESVKLELTLQKIVNGNPVNYTASLSVGKNNGGDGVPDDPPINI